MSAAVNSDAHSAARNRRSRQHWEERQPAYLRVFFSSARYAMQKESVDRSSDSIPLADLAAEAVNEASPAQSIPETIPPHARRKREGARKQEANPPVKDADDKQ